MSYANIYKALHNDWGVVHCPPEDWGGVWGYADFLEAIQQPDHPEHESMLEWVGGAFDPDAFILSEVNQLLQIVGDK